MHFLTTDLANAEYEPNEESRTKKFELLRSEKIPFFLEKLDGIAKANNGYFALKKLTWADLYFVGLINYLSYIAKTDLTANHPNLKKVVENVHAVPGIKAWIEKKPKSDR